MADDHALADELVEVVRAYVRRDVLAVVAALERADEYPEQLVAQLRDFGLFGATIPVE